MPHGGCSANTNPPARLAYKFSSSPHLTDGIAADSRLCSLGPRQVLFCDFDPSFRHLTRLHTVTVAICESNNEKFKRVNKGSTVLLEFRL